MKSRNLASAPDATEIERLINALTMIQNSWLKDPNKIEALEAKLDKLIESHARLESAVETLVTILQQQATSSPRCGMLPPGMLPPPGPATELFNGDNDDGPAAKRKRGNNVTAMLMAGVRQQSTQAFKDLLSWDCKRLVTEVVAQGVDINKETCLGVNIPRQSKRCAI